MSKIRHFLQAFSTSFKGRDQTVVSLYCHQDSLRSRNFHNAKRFCAQRSPTQNCWKYMTCEHRVHLSCIFADCLIHLHTREKIDCIILLNISKKCNDLVSSSSSLAAASVGCSPSLCSFLASFDLSGSQTRLLTNLNLRAA